MRIAAMAAGAVGAYFGARMQAAGHEVFYIARGAHLEALRKNGVTIESAPFGNLHLAAVNATDDPAQVGPVDVVLFAVKLWDVEQAAERMKPLIGPDTRVVTLQNGVDAYERIAPIVGAQHAIPGITYVVSVIDRPGVIKQVGPFQQIICGAHDGRPDARLSAFVEAAKASGIDAVLSDDIQRDRWRKFVFLTGTSGATAVTRTTLGPILKDPDMRTMFRAIMEETLAVGRARGVKLDPRYVDERMEFSDTKVPFDMKASMANDLDRGNRLELDWLAGKVSQLGKELGVPTPVNSTIYAALKRYRMGKPG